jgi:hypothetical protein
MISLRNDDFAGYPISKMGYTCSYTQIRTFINSIHRHKSYIHHSSIHYFIYSTNSPPMLDIISTMVNRPKASLPCPAPLSNGGALVCPLWAAGIVGLAVFQEDDGLLIPPRGILLVVSAGEVVIEEFRDSAIGFVVLMLGIIDEEVVTAKSVV